VLYLL
jgi:cytochrome c oxidase subunit IV